MKDGVCFFLWPFHMWTEQFSFMRLSVTHIFSSNNARELEVVVPGIFVLMLCVPAICSIVVAATRHCARQGHVATTHCFGCYTNNYPIITSYIRVSLPHNEESAPENSFHCKVNEKAMYKSWMGSTLYCFALIIFLFDVKCVQKCRHYSWNCFPNISEWTRKIEMFSVGISCSHSQRTQTIVRVLKCMPTCVCWHEGCRLVVPGFTHSFASIDWKLIKLLQETAMWYGMLVVVNPPQSLCCDLHDKFLPH